MNFRARRHSIILVETSSSENLLVCIPTAGSGARMGKYTEHLPKALLPLGKKAVISLLIEKFPEKTEFVIALGHKGDLVRDYLKLAHPKRKFQFVEVSNYSGPGSGPGLSLLQCSPFLQRPFYYLSCDTLWEGNFEPGDQSWLGVARVSEKESESFCNVRVVGSRVISIHDKVPMRGKDWFSFSGFAYIKDFREFWKTLRENQTELVKGELQVSKALSQLVREGLLTVREIEWIDLGDREKYEEQIKVYDSFDFSKADEALYIVGNRVIKFFADPVAAKNRVERIKKNPNVFPTLLNSANHFCAYEFVEGKTLYEKGNVTALSSILEWLDTNLWKKVDVEPDTVRKTCQTFYREKTFARVQAYFKKTGVRDVPTRVNGRNLQSVSQLLELVPWEELYNGVPVFFHGDLHFDHIVEEKKLGKLTLLDWRHDFGGQTDFGDIYYDLAKFLGGLLINYKYIKGNLMSYEESENEIQFDFARSYRFEEYVKIFSNFLRQKKYSERRVRILTGLIFLNMSPLHNDPFDRILYSLGKMTLAENLPSSGVFVGAHAAF